MIDPRQNAVWRRAAKIFAVVWNGPSNLDPWVRLEHRFVIVRWVGIGFVAAGLLVAGWSKQQLLCGYLILAIAAVYNSAVEHLIQHRPQLLRGGYLTIIVDSILNIAMIAVAGGFGSPFYYNLFMLVTSIAMRRGFKLATGATVIFIALDAWTHAGDGTWLKTTFLLRSGFLLLTVLLSGYLSDYAHAAESALRRRLQEANLLNEATAILSANLEVDNVLDAVVEATAHLFAGAFVVLHAYENHAAVPFQQPRSNLYRGRRRAEGSPTRQSIEDEDLPELMDQGRSMRVLLARMSGRAHPSAALLVISRTEHPLPRRSPDIVEAFLERVTLTLDKAALYASLSHQAHHDSLTDLPNRAHLSSRLAACIDVPIDKGRPFALLLMDLDGFKEVNDTFGHYVGDLLLKEISARLSTVAAESEYAPIVDTVARIGGDEFAAILRTDSLPDAQNVAVTLLEVARRPFLIEGRTLDISASIGVAFFPLHGRDPETLLRRADMAMYEAKRNGGSYAIAECHDDPRHLARLSLISDLRRALEQDEIEVFYQPKLDLTTGLVSSAEALARWPHPNRGFVPPSEFIPLAEESGSIKPLTERVLDRVLRQTRCWLDAGLYVPVSVNLSMRSLQDLDLPIAIAAALDRYGVPAQMLQLELTETTMMYQPDRTREVCCQLSSAGALLSIDDFGTGFSSLTYLQRLPVGEIKIDQSFVSNMNSQPNNMKIVHAVIDLAHRLDLKVVAEGVEDAGTLESLSALGCDGAQGYYLGLPVPAADFPQYLTRPPLDLFSSAQVSPTLVRGWRDLSGDSSRDGHEVSQPVPIPLNRRAPRIRHRIEA